MVAWVIHSNLHRERLLAVLRAFSIDGVAASR
jgi:hypothetical protein